MTKSILDSWLFEYKKNYTLLVFEMLAIMRPKDRLILQTQHRISPGKTSEYLVTPANKIVREVSQFLHIPLLDVHGILSKYYSQNYLDDDIHQNNRMSRVIAYGIFSRNYSDVQC